MKKNLKKIIAVVFLFSCLMCVPANAYTIINIDEDKAFSQDIKDKEAVSSWAKNEIELARAAGLVTENTSFYMTHDITRFQFAELAVNMVEVVTGKEIAPAPADTFTDCSEEAVLKAYAAGIVNGVGDGTFAPDQTTNREQIASMVKRAIDYTYAQTGKDITPVPASIAKFTDKNQVSSWAAESVGSLAANGIMNGTSATTLGPKNSCTIQESILLVYRVYGKF